MNVKQIALMAKKHWLETDPEFMAKVAQVVALDQEAEAAARLTLREMETRMLSGETETEAWLASREIFVFTDPRDAFNLTFD